MDQPADTSPLRLQLATLAAAIGAGMILLIGTVYFATALYYEHDHAERDARATAIGVSEMIYTSPRMWRFQTDRLAELVEDDSKKHDFGDRRRRIEITDLDGKRIALFEPDGPLWRWPKIEASSPIYDGVQIVGYLTVCGDTRHILLLGLVPLLLSILLASGVIYVLRTLPLRAIAEREGVLARRERFFRALIEKSSDITTLLKADGTLGFHSRAMVASLRYTPEELANFKLTDLVHPGDIDTVKAALRTAMTEPDAVARVEFRMRDRDGDWRVFESIGHNALHLPGVEGVVINSRDISELRARQAELRQAQKMETIGQLTGGVAHDFNNLLTAVIGSLDMLLLRPDTPADAHRMLEIAMQAAERSAMLTQRLLAFSRQQALQTESIDVNALIDGMLTLLSRAIGADIRIETQLEANWPVSTDRVQLESALLNLAVNARDAMPDGGTIRLMTRNFSLDDSDVDDPDALSSGDYVVISVSDNGSGMDPDVAARAFDPFYTTKAVGEGSGLGLSMVFGFAKQSAGHVAIASTVGRGTTVTLYLPRDTGVATAGSDAPAPLRQAASA